MGSVEAIGSRTSDSIIEEAKSYGADLIVLGTHGRRGVRRMLLGSDAEAVAREAACAVLLVRAPESISKKTGRSPFKGTNQEPEGKFPTGGIGCSAEPV